MALSAILLWFLRTANELLSFEFGCFLILANFSAIACAWWLIFRQKLIALAVPLIVIKYAILGIIIYESLRWSWVRPMWMGLGLASFLVTSVLYSLIKRA